mmetsp:Transcript_117093/g.342989  ORF Transcript_117093/g.342989 Transcript_117093/m.342989 type:complete len:325 (+) Transcript_117093:277-1251(+)
MRAAEAPPAAAPPPIKWPHRPQEPRRLLSHVLSASTRAPVLATLATAAPEASKTGSRNCVRSRAARHRRSLPPAPAAATLPWSGWPSTSHAAQSMATEMGVRTMAAGGAGSARSASHPRKRQPQATEKASRAPPAWRPRKCKTSAAAAEAQCRVPSLAHASTSKAKSSSRVDRVALFGGRSSSRTRGTISASAPRRTAEPGPLWPQASQRQAGGAPPGAAPAPCGTQWPFPQASHGRARQPSGAQQRVQAQRKPRSVSKMARRTSAPIHQRPVSWKYQLPSASPSATSLHATATMVPSSASTVTKTLGEQEWATLQATGARAQS